MCFFWCWRYLGRFKVVLRPSWGLLGAILGLMGTVRGHLRANLGRLGVILAPSWVVLEPSWGGLGGSREPTWNIVEQGSLL